MEICGANFRSSRIACLPGVPAANTWEAALISMLVQGWRIVESMAQLIEFSIFLHCSSYIIVFFLSFFVMEGLLPAKVQLMSTITMSVPNLPGYLRSRPNRNANGYAQRTSRAGMKR
jgi:hypothetical protein